MGAFGGAGVAIDTTRNKFAISDGSNGVKVFEFSDLLAIEVLRNGTSIQKTNAGSRVARAAIGAAIFGPVGVLLGGPAASTRRVEKIDRLSLMIYTKDLVSPANEILFYWATGSNPNWAVVQKASRQLDEWRARFEAILHMGIATG